MKSNLKDILLNKQKKISVGKGVPRSTFGKDGDMAIRYVDGQGLFLFIKLYSRWYSSRFSLYKPKGMENKEPIILPVGRPPKRAGELTLNTVGTENRLLMGNGGDKSLKHIIGSNPDGILDTEEIILSRAKDSGSATTEDFKILNTGTGRAYLHVQTSSANAAPLIIFS